MSDESPANRREREQHEKLRTLFMATCDLSHQEQADYLDRHCGNDPELRKALAELLTGDSSGRLFRDGETAAGVDFQLDTNVEPALPRKIGAYEVERSLGSGGMGIVYLAQQKNPNRQVAIKVIREGMISSQLLKRFDLEASVLGRLRHPGIASIYEAGTFTEAGSPDVPFIAMEYIDGTPLRKYVEQTELTTRELLELVIKICDAVNHAHQRGVIHRDLKPANVLVKSGGQPIIVDFGVARALTEELGTLPDQTRTGQWIGTLPYMSPEQVRGNSTDVDMRSDVYALGLIAYELLAEQLPYDSRNADYLKAAAAISEQEPASLATKREYRGDLNNVVLKALAKEPDRRYQTAQSFAEDLQRYLDNEPVEARRANAVERSWRWCQRNPTVASLAAAMIVIIFVGASGWAYLERERAQVVSSAAASIKDSIDKALLHQNLARAAVSNAEPRIELQIRELEQGLVFANEGVSLADTFPVSQSLSRSIRDVRDRIEDQTVIARQNAATVASNEALVADLETIRLRSGLGELAPRVPTDHPSQLHDAEVRSAGAAYEHLFRRAGFDIIAEDPREAAAKFIDSPIREKLVAAMDVWYQSTRYTYWPSKQRAQRSKKIRRKLLEITNLVDGDGWRRELRKALTSSDLNRLSEMAVTEEMLSQSDELICSVANHLRDESRLGLSTELLLKAQQQRPDDYWLNYELGSTLANISGREFEGLGFIRAAVALRPQSSATLTSLSRLLFRLRKYDEAELVARKAIQADPAFGPAFLRLGESLVQSESSDPLVPFYHAINLDFSPGVTATAYHSIANWEQQRGEIEKAISMLRKAVTANSSYADGWITLARYLERSGYLEESEDSYRSAINILPRGRNTVFVRLSLGNLLVKRGKLAAAKKEFCTAVENAPTNAGTHYVASQKLRKMRNTNGQFIALEDAVMIAGKSCELEPENWRFHLNYGIANYRSGLWNIARKALRKSVELTPKQSTIYPEQMLFLAMSYEKLGEETEAKMWYQKARKLQSNRVPNQELDELFREAEQLLDSDKSD